MQTYAPIYTLKYFVKRILKYYMLYLSGE